MAVQFVAVAFTWLFTLLYTTALHALGGQTVGKMAVSIRAVGIDGGLLAGGAGLLRYLAYFVSLLPLALGFVMAGLRPGEARRGHPLAPRGPGGPGADGGG